MSDNNRGPAGWPTTPERLLPDLGTRNNAAAWERFEKYYGAVLRGFCRRRGLQHADAEDITQRVLIDVCRQIAAFEYRPERGRFRAWLATIANRAIWRFRRRERGKIAVVGLGELPEVEEPEDRRWTGDFNTAVLDVSLERIRGEFTEEEWLAFESVWRHDQPSAEVAARLGRDVGWIYQTKFKVLQRLKREIGTFFSDFTFPS